MTTIYIIKAYGGSYDDAWERNLFAVGDEAQAMVAVDALETQHERITQIFPKVREFFNNFTKENAHRFTHEPTPDYPKGPAKPTKETRAEYAEAVKKWTEETQPISLRNQARSVELNEVTAKATKEFAKTLGANEDDMNAMGLGDNTGYHTYPSFDRDTHYSYEELELK